MPGIFPSLEPEPKILPLIPVDRALVQGVEQVALPPNHLEETCLLHHAGVRQAVYVGTHIIDRLCASPPSSGNHLPTVLLYRHILDIGDSIGTLMRFGSASNAAILLRTLFETVIGLEFLLQNNTFQTDRANCYWACHRIRQMENFTKYDPSTESGREFHKILDSDPILSKANFSRKDHSRERKILEDILSRVGYKEHWDKYKHAKKKKQPRDWYALCSTANNIRELSMLVGMEAQYAILYAQLSTIAHGADVITDVLNFTGGTGAFMHQVRGPENKLDTVANFAATYLLQSNQKILDTYYPGKNDLRDMFGQWYLQYRRYYRWAFTPKPSGTEDAITPQLHPKAPTA